MILTRTAPFAALLAAANLGMAQQNIPKVAVKFPGGQNSVTLKGTIKGYDVVDYTLSVEGGRRYGVDLKAGGSTYFNIIAPGEDSALFIGETIGRKFEDSLPKSGEHTVRVYQMRSSARRGTVSNFTITFSRPAGSTAASGETGPTKYNAKGMTKCSAGGPGLGSQCEFRVVRKPNKTAEVWLQNAAAKEKFRVLYFEKGEFTTNDGAKINVRRESDNWYVDAGGKEFYLIPDAMLFGG